MRLPTLAAVAAMALVALAGCGGGTAETVGTATDTTTATESPASPVETGTASPTATDPATTSPTGTSTGLERFRAAGTEPFWSVEVDGTTLKYTDLGQDEPQERTLTATRSGTPEAPVYTGNNEGTEFTLTVRPGDCSDGMSDITYPYRAEFRYGERTLNGCAST